MKTHLLFAISYFSLFNLGTFQCHGQTFSKVIETVTDSVQSTGYGTFQKDNQLICFHERSANTDALHLGSAILSETGELLENRFIEMGEQTRLSSVNESGNDTEDYLLALSIMDNGIWKAGLMGYSHDLNDSLWLKTVALQDTSLYAIDCQSSTDGGYLFLCASSASNGENRTILLTKYDALLNIEWQSTIAPLSVNALLCQSFKQLEDGSIVIVGSTNWEWYQDIFYMKVSPLGETLDFQFISGDLSDAAQHLAVNGDSYMITGSYGAGPGIEALNYWALLDQDSDEMVMEYFLDQETFGDFYLVETILMDNGDFISVGYVGSFNNPNGAILKHNSAGEILWIRTYDCNQLNGGDCSLRSIQLTEDDHILATGRMDYGPDPLDFGTWILKLDAEGCLEPDCINLNISDASESPLQMDIFPNPAMNELFLKTSEIKDDVILRIQSLDGRTAVEKTITFQDANQTLSLAEMVQSLKAGWYVVSCYNKKQGVAFTERLILGN